VLGWLVVAVMDEAGSILVLYVPSFDPPLITLFGVVTVFVWLADEKVTLVGFGDPLKTTSTTMLSMVATSVKLRVVDALLFVPDPTTST
jgi:hypothetical protein